MAGFIVFVIVVLLLMLVVIFLRRTLGGGEALDEALVTDTEAEDLLAGDEVFAKLEETYHSSDGRLWAVFHDEHGEYHNLAVTPGVFAQLEEGHSAPLLLDTYGNKLLRFGAVENPDWDIAALESYRDQLYEAGGGDGPAQYSFDQMDRFWSAPLPAAEYVAEEECDSLAEFDPRRLLEVMEPDRRMRLDTEVQELFTRVYGETLRELEGYARHPRKAVRGDYVRRRSNVLHLQLAVTENTFPLRSQITATLSVNQMEL